MEWMSDEQVAADDIEALFDEFSVGSQTELNGLTSTDEEDNDYMKRSYLLPDKSDSFYCNAKTSTTALDLNMPSVRAVIDITFGKKPRVTQEDGPKSTRLELSNNNRITSTSGFVSSKKGNIISGTTDGSFYELPQREFSTKPRPIISSPVLEASTSKKFSGKKFIEIPTTPLKLISPHAGHRTPSGLSTLLRKEKKDPPKARPTIDKAKLKDIKISAPILQVDQTTSDFVRKTYMMMEKNLTQKQQSIQSLDRTSVDHASIEHSTMENPSMEGSSMDRIPRKRTSLDGTTMERIQIKRSLIQLTSTASSSKDCSPMVYRSMERLQTMELPSMDHIPIQRISMEHMPASTSMGLTSTVSSLGDCRGSVVEENRSMERMPMERTQMELPSMELPSVERSSMERLPMKSKSMEHSPIQRTSKIKPAARPPSPPQPKPTQAPPTSEYQLPKMPQEDYDDYDLLLSEIKRSSSSNLDEMYSIIHQLTAPPSISSMRSTNLFGEIVNEMRNRNLLVRDEVESSSECQNVDANVEVETKHYPSLVRVAPSSMSQFSCTSSNQALTSTSPTVEREKAVKNFSTNLRSRIKSNPPSRSKENKEMPTLKRSVKSSISCTSKTSNTSRKKSPAPSNLQSKSSVRSNKSASVRKTSSTSKKTPDIKRSTSTPKQAKSKKNLTSRNHIPPMGKKFDTTKTKTATARGSTKK